MKEILYLQLFGDENLHLQRHRYITIVHKLFLLFCLYEKLFALSLKVYHRTQSTFS